MKNLLKSETFRALLLLSALASSGLVLEAARRWWPGPDRRCRRR